MRHPSSLQISDLEAIPSGFEQELTVEEAEKIVGGTNLSDAISVTSGQLSSVLRPSILLASRPLIPIDTCLPGILQPIPPPPPPPLINPVLVIYSIPL